MTTQAIPSITTTSTAPVSSSTSTVNIELVTPYNAGLGTTAARQVMCLGDPENGNMIADIVGNRVPGANDNALVVALKGGSSDLQTIAELLSSILMELKRQNAASNAAPTSDSF